MKAELFAKALAHRTQLRGVTFIGITGSRGKTTTKDLATGLLAPTIRGSSNPGSGNCGAELIDHLLSVEPSHVFCIQELGAWGPGTLDPGLALIQPTVGVVLNVRRDHYSAFHGLEHTQAEKAKVVSCLPPTGTAILNADDRYVWSMRNQTAGHLLSFGLSDDADLRIHSVRACWPERLSFDLSFHGRHRHVRTQLIGEHIVGSAVAAIAIAHTLGVTIEDSVERFAKLQPTPRRMSAVVTSRDIAVVRDDFKAVSDSLEEFLSFLEKARAVRKIAVVGQISDYPGRSRSIYTSFLEMAAKVVDLLIFVGERPESLWGTDSSRFPAEFNRAKATVQVFGTVRDASQFLLSELRSGDLLVLKGSGPADHLERILLAHQTAVRCWRAHCGLTLACDSCNLLARPAEPHDAVPENLRTCT